MRYDRVAGNTKITAKAMGQCGSAAAAHHRAEGNKYMADIFNYHRRSWDALKDNAGSTAMALWGIFISICWLAGIVVMLGLVCRLTGFIVKPLFDFGYNIVPSAQGCLNGACEMVLK